MKGINILSEKLNFIKIWIEIFFFFFNEISCVGIIYS